MKTFILAIVASILSFGSGCRTIEYKAEGRHLKVVTFAFDTKIGKVEIITPEGGKLVLENLDASSQALQVANEALKTIKR